MTQPFQIASVRRFDLLQEMASLVTWIHNGTWLDCKLFWGPQIRASQRASSSSYSLADVNSAVRKAALCYRKPELPAIDNISETKKKKKSEEDVAVAIKMPEEEKNSLLYSPVSDASEEKKFVSEDGPDRRIVCDDEVDKIFDGDIANVETLLGFEDKRKRSESTCSFSDSDLFELDDDILLGR